MNILTISALDGGMSPNLQQFHCRCVCRHSFSTREHSKPGFVPNPLVEYYSRGTETISKNSCTSSEALPAAKVHSDVFFTISGPSSGLTGLCFALSSTVEDQTPSNKMTSTLFPFSPVDSSSLHICSLELREKRRGSPVATKAARRGHTWNPQSANSSAKMR